jgi:hypothetical protein
MFISSCRLSAFLNLFSLARAVAGCIAVVALTLPAGAKASKATVGSGPGDDFSPLVELAPFVVRGQQLAVSVHARSSRDRRYAEEFAHEVMKVVYEGVTPSTGKGLVIIGKKGEPHPIFVFRKFLALAESGKLDPEIAARGPELFAMLNHWEHSVGDGKAQDADPTGPVDMEFEKIVTALPLPLKGIGAKLYQLAWFEHFNDAKVDARLRALRPADLERDLFAHFDWVFYLPPKGAFDQMLDQLIADEMKEDDAGFFARTAVKGVMLVVKPKIRKAIEGLRKGVLLQTIMQARTKFTDEEVSALVGAYIGTMLPDDDEEGKPRVGTDHERAVNALREQVRENSEKARNRETPAVDAAAASPSAGQLDPTSPEPATLCEVGSARG